MSALLRSQEKTVAFCPGFNEPLACKEIKESAYESCPHYYYIGVYPHQLDNLDAVLAEALQQIINSKTRQE